MTRTSALLLAAGSLACAGCDDARRFEPVAEGIVRDVRTGLEWMERDHLVDLEWFAADVLCRSLWRSGRVDWRLPDVEELVLLYDEGQSQACGDSTCRVDPALALGGPFFWSATGAATQAGPNERRFYVDLRFGSRLAPRLRPELTRRVLCVRGESKEADSKSRPPRSEPQASEGR